MTRRKSDVKPVPEGQGRAADAGSGDGGKAPETPGVFKRFGELLALFTVMIVAGGVFQIQINSLREDVRDLRNQVTDLKVMVARLQEASNATKERITREERQLTTWTTDQFSDICEVLGGKYKFSEHYCELKDKSLKYHPLVLE